MIKVLVTLKLPGGMGCAAAHAASEQTAPRFQAAREAFSLSGRKGPRRRMRSIMALGSI